MEIYRKTLRIALIGIEVEGSIPFEFSERCKYFEEDISEADATFQIAEVEEVRLEKYETVYEASNFKILVNEKERVRVQYKDGNKNEVSWYLHHDLRNPNLYRISVCESTKRILHAINPLQFLELSEFLIRYSAVILHGSVVEYQGKGIVFTAPSGTGKSTQASLWKQYYRANIINGDRAIVRKDFDYQVCGSPYAGSSHIYKNENVGLTAIVVLKQAKNNKIRKMNKKEAYLCLLSEMSVSRWDKKTVEKQTEWLIQLIDDIPVYLLECLPDKGAVDILYQELGGMGNGIR